jgi:hypothetical protein
MAALPNILSLTLRLGVSGLNSFGSPPKLEKLEISWDNIQHHVEQMPCERPQGINETVGRLGDLMRYILIRNFKD